MGVCLSEGGTALAQPVERLFARFALPDDPDLDTFTSGVEEIDAYFRGRHWFDTAKGVAAPPTYQFVTEAGGDVVGYAAVVFRNIDHPHDVATSRARYLVIYVTGVHERFKAKENPRAPGETYAVSMFRMLESIARSKADCVGVSLWVRADNARAIAFYKKVGFEPDPTGPVQRNGGTAHVTMRKPLV